VYGGGGVKGASIKEKFSLIFERKREKNNVVNRPVITALLSPQSASLFSKYIQRSFVTIAHKNKKNNDLKNGVSHHRRHLAEKRETRAYRYCPLFPVFFSILRKNLLTIC
jgi:hypothetical protein